MSTHDIPVLKIETIEKHPNADSLEIVKVFGWACCVKLGDFKVGELVVYIPPDYIVNTLRPEFSFLHKPPHTEHRIKTKKLRGIYSMGLLIKAPENLNEGDNAIDILEIKRYEPKILIPTKGVSISGPPLVYVKYDVENLRRYTNIFIPDEEIIATEKIHGASARFVYSNDIMYCGSRNTWKKESDDNLWWKCLNNNPGIKSWCLKYPDYILYGEVFGQVQNLRYGSKPGDIFFAAFDVMKDGRWLNYDDAIKLTSDYLSWAPLVWRGKYNLSFLETLSNTLDSKWSGANHMAEGIVIRPPIERQDYKIGRVQLKLVSNRYLEKSK